MQVLVLHENGFQKQDGRLLASNCQHNVIIAIRPYTMYDIAIVGNVATSEKPGYRAYKCDSINL